MPKSIISLYNPTKPGTVYCQKCWWGDGWDWSGYGQDYDFSRPFFEQFAELQEKVPKLAMVNDDGVSSINCEYTQDFSYSKNCYMVFVAWKVENSAYNYYITSGKEIYDSLHSMGECESVYETIWTEKCYRCRFVYYSAALADCSFCYDCRDCSDCFMSVGLRHKRYYFKNQQYTKEEYERIISEYRLNTWSGIEKAKAELAEFKLKYPRKSSLMRNCVNCTGDYLINGKNAKLCFGVLRAEDCKWIENADTPKDCYDLSIGGELSQCYEGITPDHSALNRFSIFSWKNTDVFYVDACHSCQNVFGCVGLRKGKYCILNRQYSKEEYEALLLKIKTQMDEMPYVDKNGNTYRFGEFFPAPLSYFAYNASAAQDSIPLEQTDAEKQGFTWQDGAGMTRGKETVRAIPETIAEVPDDIIKDILACAQCGRNYRIVPQELEFYRKMNIPLPRRCFYCRHSERMSQRNPFKLWTRQCDCNGKVSTNGLFNNTAVHAHGDSRCPNVFETTYAPDRPEIVYCENCYNSEIA